EPKVLMAATSAAGATPLIRIVQPGGNGWAGCTKSARSWTTAPWAAMDETSPNISPTSEGESAPSPVKSGASKTTERPSRTKSGLCTSTDVATTPTFTPRPSATSCAAGVGEPGWCSTFSTSRASGSSNGCAGSSGQIADPDTEAGVGTPDAAG